MADTEKKAERPESPTTAREMDFDEDEQTNTTSTIKKGEADSSTETPHPSETAATTPASATAVPAPQAQVQSQPQTTLPSTIPEPERTLREAFPSISPSVVRAVLKASRGELEPAFEALLEMTDPSAAAANTHVQAQAHAQAREEQPPVQPPRPPPQSEEARQLESDEAYARRLAEEFESQERYGYGRQGQGQGRGQERRSEMSPDRDRNFFDDAMDELPVIRENIRQGFLQTQSRVNNFLSGLKKRMDGDEEAAPPLPQRRNEGQSYGPGSGPYDRGATQGLGRRSGEMDRYDADPEEIRGDFGGLTLRDDEAPSVRRPPTNPDLFKPTPKTPGSDRKVAFSPAADGTVAKASPAPATVQTPLGTPSAGKSKWTKLAQADPNPLGDDDPFSLGDSDDEEPKTKADGKVEGEKRAEENKEGEVAAGSEKK